MPSWQVAAADTGEGVPAEAPRLDDARSQSLMTAETAVFLIDFRQRPWSRLLTPSPASSIGINTEKQSRVIICPYFMVFSFANLTLSNTAAGRIQDTLWRGCCTGDGDGLYC